MWVYISPHALERWRERIGPADLKKLRRLVNNRLRTQLRLGLSAKDEKAFALDVYPDVRAILSIDSQGYWVVETFYRVFPGESEISTESEEVGIGGQSLARGDG